MEAEHLTLRIVGLYQPITVEEDALARIEFCLLLLVAHPRHEPQGHPPRPQLLCLATMPEVGQVVASVCVAQATALWVEDGVEAGYEHVGGYAGKQRLVDLGQYLPRREGVQSLSGELQHAAGGGHHKRCGNALARRVANDHS